MLWLYNIVEPVSDLGAVALLENKVVRAIEDWESFCSDELVDFQNAGPGCHTCVGVTFLLIAGGESLTLWYEVIGSRHIKAPRLPTREAVVMFFRVGVRAASCRFRAMLIVMIQFTTRATIACVVSDVLGDWKAHLVDPEAKLRR